LATVATIAAIPAQILFGTIALPQVLMSLICALAFLALSGWLFTLGLRNYKSVNANL
jgi:ABC-type uncharacterized transport system permease subunit